MERIVFAAALLSLFLFAIESAWAVPAYIDRTKRTIDVPAECLVAPNGINAVSYNNGAGVNLVNIDARFTLVLSTTERLQARQHNTALDLSWYHFVPGNAQYNLNLNNAQRLIRAATMARCGLPVNPGDNHLYQFPASQQAMTTFLRFAMGDGGFETRQPTGYTLIGNGEREALLMYAANRIKFDLTPTIVARDQVCRQYWNVNGGPGCMEEVPGANRGDVRIGYLYEGMNRISYTGHEFWMMFSIDAFRNKVFFTNGDRLVNGNRVDRFLTWSNVNNATALENDPNGIQANYPVAPYRFQDIYNANDNNRAFYQNLLDAFLAAYKPHIMVYNQF